MRILPVALAGAGLAIRPVAADPEPALIVDPVADHLAMNVPDRKANAGQLLILNRRVRDVPRIESLSAGKLLQRGYALPRW